MFLLTIVNTILLCKPVFSIIDYHVEIKDSNYWGTYLPENYIENLLRLRSHGMALIINARQEYHDVLFVTPNEVYSDVGFHDQYAIPNEQIKKYKFIPMDGKYCIIDDKNHQYIKIGADDKTYSVAVKEYVLLKLYDLSISKIKKEVICTDGIFLIIDNDYYEILLDMMFLPVDNIMCVRNRTEKKIYGLKENGGNILVIELEHGDEHVYTYSNVIRYNFSFLD